MIETDMIEQLKEKTRIEYQRALCIWDLPLGLMIIVYAISVSMHNNYAFAIFYGIIFFSVNQAQKKYIFPRLGRVEFDKKAKKQDRLFLIILAYLFFMTGVPVYLIKLKAGTDLGLNPQSLTLYLSVMCTLIIALGGFLRRTLLYIYGGAVYIPIILGLYFPNPVIIIAVTGLALAIAYVLLKLFVYDWSGLDQAQQRPGIVGHFLVGFTAVFFMAYIIVNHFNPELIKAMETIIFANANVFRGILVAGVIFLIAYAYRIKSFFWYSGAIVILTIIWSLHIMSRYYFISLFMLFGISVMIYRLFELERFIREHPVPERTDDQISSISQE